MASRGPEISTTDRTHARALSRGPPPVPSLLTIARLSQNRPHPANPTLVPAATRSQSASPRLLEGGRRNEGARGRRVAAGGAARALDAR